MDESNIIKTLAIIWIMIAILGIIYCFGYMILDCMHRPINFGIKRDAIIHPTTTVAIEIDDEQVIDIENVVFVHVNSQN